MSGPDDAPCDPKMELLRASQEQVKARVAVDVLRYVDPDEDDVEELRRRARNYLLAYFGSPKPPTDDY